MVLKFSRERAAHLARILVSQMERQPGVRLLKDRDIVVQSIHHALLEAMKRDEERQILVRQRLAAMKDLPPPASKEWESLYRRLLDEEYDRQGFELT